ncbi:MAG: RNA polymerase sigma factor [Acidimicrobiales bacterium]|jgi:RNA polymerase sigma-70 factor (ECF subfamily)
MAAARAGDRAALESLLRAHYDRCYALCRRLLGDDEDALDATQEAMIAIARGIGSFDERSAFATWVYRVTANAAFDELRRRRRRPQIDRPTDLSEGAEATEASGGRLASARDEVGESVSARLTLDGALRELSTEHRTAVVLRDMMDLDYREIAEILLVPIGTVRSRIARGRAALAQLLSEEAPIRDAAVTVATGSEGPEGNQHAPGDVQHPGQQS